MKPRTLEEDKLAADLDIVARNVMNETGADLVSIRTDKVWLTIEKKQKKTKVDVVWPTAMKKRIRP